ncbi:MAG: hypothetical protein R2909_17365 [Gemmatimonadales bacterium]
MPTAFLARIAPFRARARPLRSTAAIAQGQRALLEEIRRIEPISGGTLGIAAVHLETGRSFSATSGRAAVSAGEHLQGPDRDSGLLKLVEEGKLTSTG